MSTIEQPNPHGSSCWSQKMERESISIRGKVFKSLRKVCKETKLKEFQFELIHRIIVTKRELFKYGIKADDECCFCGDKRTLSTTRLLIALSTNDHSQISPTIEEMLFGIYISVVILMIIVGFTLQAKLVSSKHLTQVHLKI